MKRLVPIVIAACAPLDGAPLGVVTQPLPRAATEVLSSIARAGFETSDDPRITIAADGARFSVRGPAKISGWHLAGAERIAASIGVDDLRVAHEGGDDASIVLSPLDPPATGATAESARDAVVVSEIAPGVDRAVVARPGRVDEIRVLSAATAAAPIRLSVTFGAGIVDARVRGTALDLFDARGSSRLRIGPVETAVSSARGGASIAWNGSTKELEIVPNRPGAGELVVVIPVRAKAGLAVARDHATATSLGDRALIVGGRATSAAASAHASTEIWQPSSGTFRTSGDLSVARAAHAAATTAGGILVVGGVDRNGAIIASAERWSSSTETWSVASPMTEARRSAAAVALDAGRVLVVGGEDATSARATAEIFDPSTNAFAKTGSMSVPRFAHGAIRLDDGRVLVTGGRDGATTHASVEIWDPRTGEWTLGPPMRDARHGHSIHRLDDGSVLVVGGLVGAGERGLDSSERFRAGQGWSPSPYRMERNRGRFAEGTLRGGRVVVAGGYDGGTLRGVGALLSPRTGNWNSVGSLWSGRDGPASAVIDELAVIAVGGRDTSDPSDEADAFDLAIPGQPCVPLAGADALCAIACIDLVCCDRACDGACEACNLAGREGACSPVDGTPVPPRTCTAGSALCVAGACASTCTRDEDCARGYVCLDSVVPAGGAGKACVARRSIGETCRDPRECGSGVCGDGVCCEAACADPCQACDVPSGLGACTDVGSGPPPREPRACGGYACGATGCRTRCTLAEHCVEGFRCTSGACTPRPSRECDGSGLASVETATGAQTSCGAYRCDSSGECRTRCVGTGDCAPDHACDLPTATCVPTDARRTGGCAVATTDRGRARCAVVATLGLLLVILVRRRGLA
jgi:hypothetical protein